MAENSKIEWTDHTFNPWRGCTHARLPSGESHPGCDHCYAEAMSKRNPKALGVWGESGVRVVGAPAYWKQPIKWNEAAKAEGIRRRVFCASLADVFEDWVGPVFDHTGTPSGRTMDSLRRDLFALIDATPSLDWLLLTKRPRNILRMWPIEPTGESAPPFPGAPGALGESLPTYGRRYRNNVWLLTSVSNQTTADVLVPELLMCRHLVPVLGLSVEPLLGAINLRTGVYEMPGSGELRGTSLSALDWVIVGGESGHYARPMQPEWARTIRDQCESAGVAYFFKQWGEWRPPETDEDVYGAVPGLSKVGKHAAGRRLDGVEHSAFPEAKAVGV